MVVTPASQCVGAHQTARRRTGHGRDRRAVAGQRGTCLRGASVRANQAELRSTLHLSSVTASVDLCSARDTMVGARTSPKADPKPSPYAPRRSFMSVLFKSRVN